MNSSISPISVGGRSDLEGHIQVIFGPMFSGKTTELMRRIRRYTHANKRCQVIKYKNDTRYDDEMASTHDMQKCVARGCNKLSELTAESLADVDVIGIDEGQFFVDCVYYADLWASQGKVVIVAALDATFERKPFGHILELIPVSEQVMKLNAVCMLCHREASFTKRIGSETAVEVIGGADKYLSTCRECFEKPADSPKQQHTSPSAHALQNCSPLPSPMLSAADAEALEAPLPANDAADEELAALPRAALSNNKRICGSSSSPSRLRSITDAHNKLSEEVSKKRKNVEGSEQEEKRQMLDNKENMRQAVC